ncbi:hypothetical protein [Dactylosporangium cerinum]
MTSFAITSVALDTTTNLAKSRLLWPQPRTIARFSVVPARPPSGMTFDTALPERFSVNARRLVRPGSAAVSTTVCTQRPTSHTTPSTSSHRGPRPEIRCPARDQEAPVDDRCVAA